MKPRRRILKADIRFLSLCPAGKNLLPVLYKSTDTTFEATTICKALPDFEEKGELLIVPAAPNFVDDEGDIMDAAAVQSMIHSFAENGHQLDIRHNFKALSKEQIVVVENFQIQPKDARFADWKDAAGNAVDVTGGWGILAKVKDPGLRAKYKSGEWHGVSVAGPADCVELTKERTNPSPSKGDLDMEKAELNTLLAANNAALAPLIAAELTKSLTTAGVIKATTVEKEDDKPAKFVPAEYEGDGTSLDRERHALEQQIAKCWHGVDVSDAPAYKKAKGAATQLEKELEVVKTNLSKAKKKGGKGKSEDEMTELEKAQARVAELEKATNQGDDDEDDDAPAVGTSTRLTKEQVSHLEMANKLGESYNKQHGRA